MLRTSAHGSGSDGRRRIYGEVALAAGFLVFAGALAYGATSLRGPIGHSPAAESSSKPSASPSSIPSLQDSVAGQPVEVAPADVAGVLRSQAGDINPLLVITVVPEGATAYVTASPNGFTVEYRSGTADVALLTAAPGWELQDHVQRTFRGVTAVYQASDPAMPQAGQFLTWVEPGVSTLNPAGVPYFLKVGGMTEAEFWKLAGSIQPLPEPGSGAG